MFTTERYLRGCNLIFTDTATDVDFARVDFKNIKVNYDNCVNLYNLAKSFNDLYTRFHKEYEELEKLNLGKRVWLCYYSTYDLSNDHYRVLDLCVEKPVVSNKEIVNVILREYNKEIDSYIINYGDRRRSQKSIDLDKEIVKKYLDLFEKYSELFEIYDAIKCSELSGGQLYSLGSRINTHIEQVKGGYREVGEEPNILEGLHNLTFALGSRNDKYIQIRFNLGENFGIDYENSTVDFKSSSKYNEDYDTLVNKVFVNKKHTK